MAETTVFESGGYRYVRGRFQYSGGVWRSRDSSSNAPGSRGPCRLTKGSAGSSPISTLSDGRPPRSAPVSCARRAVHRRRLHSLQSGLRGHARTVGHLQGRGQSRRAVKRVSRGASSDPNPPSMRSRTRCRPRRRCGGAEELRHRRLGRSARRTGRVRGTDHPSRRHLARRHAGKGAVRARSVGASDGGVGPDLGGRHHEPGLHGPRNPWVSRRRDRPPGCGAGRCHMDLRPAAGPGTGI